MEESSSDSDESESDRSSRKNKTEEVDPTLRRDCQAHALHVTLRDYARMGTGTASVGVDISLTGANQICSGNFLLKLLWLFFGFASLARALFFAGRCHLPLALQPRLAGRCLIGAAKIPNFHSPSPLQVGAHPAPLQTLRGLNSSRVPRVGFVAAQSTIVDCG